MNKELLIEKSKYVRKNIINMIYEAKSGHPGGSLSCADIITYLYFERMNINKDNYLNDERDRFVLSKGHAAPALYGVLCEKGFFPKEELKTLRKVGALLQGHPDKKKVPGVDVSTGSLGQGISNAAGMALGLKLRKSPANVYTVLGDGELQEGLVWEAAMAAAHYKLSNLVAIVDYNGLQIDGKNEDVMTIAPLEDKFSGFGWNVVKCNGHDFDEIHAAFDKTESCLNRPTIIIANTIKGKGVSFMENKVEWHGTAPNSDQKEKALYEIENEIGGE